MTQNNFKDLTLLTKVTQVFLGIQVFCGIIAVLANVFESLLICTLIERTETAEGFDALMACCSGLSQFIFFFVGGIIFLVWTYKANYNAHQLSDVGMKFTPGWSIGWYFVPILFYWKPYQAMVEIWKVSASPSNINNAPSTILLSFWWFLWIVSNLLANVGLRFMGTNLEPSLEANMLYLLSDLMAIPMNIIVILIVGKIWQMQKSSYKKSSSAPRTY